MKHTPGPWVANAGHDSYLRETSSDDPIHAYHVSESSEVGYTVAIVLGDVPELDCAANARLIAAAPELLEALKLVRSIISDGAAVGFNYADGDWAERLFASQATSHAAITKAEGKL